MNKTILFLLGAAGYILWMRKKTTLAGPEDDAVDQFVKLMDATGNAKYVDALEKGGYFPTIDQIERETGVRLPKEIAEGMVKSSGYLNARKNDSEDMLFDPGATSATYAAKFAAQQVEPAAAWGSDGAKELRLANGPRSFPNLEQEAGQSSGWGETTQEQINAYHRRLAANQRRRFVDINRTYAAPREPSRSYKPAQYPTRTQYAADSGIKIDPTFLRRR